MIIINANVSQSKKAPGKYLIVKNKISAKYVLMRKPAYCICKNKGTDQLRRTSQCRFLARHSIISGLESWSGVE